MCKPNVDQRLFYYGHYKMHGILTQILINFNGKIIGFITNVPGKINDALIAIYAEFFRDVLKGRFALGDPGFAGVDWVVCGLRYKQKNSDGAFLFDKISRSEQVLIENVNKFLKDCKSINKDCAFFHGRKKLLYCIITAIGLYNKKLDWGYFARTTV